MPNHMYVTWYGMRMMILVVLSIRTSHILFSLCSLSRLCRSKGLHVSTTSAVSLVGSVEIQGPVYIRISTCTYVYIWNVRENAGRAGRYIIREDERKRVARDAENYPQLSRAYAIHHVGVGGGDDDGFCLSSRDESTNLHEFKNTITGAIGQRRCVFGLAVSPSFPPFCSNPRPDILLRDDGDRRCMRRVNDIFQCAGVSLVSRLSPLFRAR